MDDEGEFDFDDEDDEDDDDDERRSDNGEEESDEEVCFSLGTHTVLALLSQN